ncbi:histone PARylation factor 1 [Pectinophora gossypiella]|uniref:histone PARylation factor 1 n=1 Tax=Pectinophora gossypiella TaxID=13191 RepID=UPI00214F4933|nr:histone PARylation factor 1 [Pectinophora gossypiella]
MSEEWQAYIKDPRKVCKYGANCYQKNPDHHKHFKHPPINHKRKAEHKAPAKKRFRHSSEDRDNKPSHNDVKDTSGDKNDEDTSNLKNESSVEDTASTSNTETKQAFDESFTITLPETISYHDENDYTLLKELFLVEMPLDFFQFHKCLQEEKDFEKMLASVNLELIGPFDLLLGKLPVLDDKDLYLIHWRFFYDPPEFQAILKKKGKSEYHIGYFRDEPDAAPVFLASSDSAKGCHITPIAENIFATVYLYLQNEKKTSPFVSAACQKLMDKVKHWAETHKYSLEEYNMKKRLMQSVTKTFHGAGIVVPFNKKTELGYRKLVQTDANLKKLFAKLESAKSQRDKDKLLSEIQPVITYASIAVDECDFGTGLEAGIDLFCSGLKELQHSALSSLQAVYTLLNREAFSKIIQAHIKYRRKGPNMSLMNK